MKNPQQAAAAFAPDIPAEQLARIETPLAALEAAFRPLVGRIPHETEPAYLLAVAPEAGA